MYPHALDVTTVTLSMVYCIRYHPCSISMSNIVCGRCGVTSGPCRYHVQLHMCLHMMIPCMRTIRGILTPRCRALCNNRNQSGSEEGSIQIKMLCPFCWKKSVCGCEGKPLKTHPDLRLTMNSFHHQNAVALKRLPSGSSSLHDLQTPPSDTA